MQIKYVTKYGVRIYEWSIVHVEKPQTHRQFQ